MSASLDSRVQRQLARAYTVLGLPPGDSLANVEAAYFTRRAALIGREHAEQNLKQLEKAIRFIKATHRLGNQKPTRGRASVADQLARSLRLLGLSQGATARDVDAVAAIIRKTVTDRDRLREYQKAAYFVKTHGRTRRSARSRRHVSRFLIVTSLALVALTVFSGFQLATRFRQHFVRFEVGEDLYRLDENSRFGEVVGFEEDHRFPNGAQRDAYQILLHPDAKEAWISATTARSALKTKP